MKVFTRKHLNLLSCIVIFISCISATQPVQDEITWETLLQSSTGGSATPKIIVAKEPTVVANFFKEVNQNGDMHLAAPKVDYNHEMLLILCMGQKRTGGYHIDVNAIKEKATTINVTVTETAPGKDEIVTLATTKPFTVVKLKTSNKRLVFRKL